MFVALARAVHRRRGAVVAASVAVLALSVAALVRGGRLSSGTIEGTEAARAEALASGASAAAHEFTLAVLFHSDTWTHEAPQFREAVRSALGRAAALPSVASVVQPFDEATGGRLLAAGGHDVLGLVRLAGGEREAVQAFPAVRRALEAAPLEVWVTGKIAFLHSLNTLLESDLLRAELISFPLALLVLLRVFRTLAAALLPVAVGGLAVMSGVAGVLALSHLTHMAQYTLNVVSLIGLGVAIDYSLFIVSRFRAELEQGDGVQGALERTLDTAGRAVAFSGLAVAVGLSGLLFYERSYLSAMGLGGAVVVAFAVLYALTFLPALLSWLGPRIDAGRVPFPRLGGRTGVWHRLATWVMRHPWRVLVPTLVVLVALGLPFRRLQLAATDLRALPAGAEPRRGAERLARLFPREAATRILVVAAFPGPSFTPERVRALGEVRERLARLPGVTGVESILDVDERLSVDMLAMLAGMSRPPPELEPARQAFFTRDAAVLQVLTDAPATSAAARDLVERIRAQRGAGDGTLWVGGQSATDVDATAFVRRHTPAAVGFVVGLTCLVLLVLLRSVVLPLKAMVMNLLSIAGSFGALVWIFQDGHLRGLLRFEPAPIEPSLPILLFCVLFGLSMDYEVLLLSRMREEWQRSHDNTHAVAEGLERTGGLITNAAAIMVAVFAAFALAQVVVVKAMGVGMALAVLIDATLVRVLLVPAMMRLMGDVNWWMPRPLERLFTRFHRPRQPSEGPTR
jgi:RND superfamily putative drug exporter